MSDPTALIERYFEQDLSPEELAAFERRLEEDPAFAEAFQLEKDLIEGIKTMDDFDLRKELETIYKEEILEAGATDSPTNSDTKNSKTPKEAKTKSISRRWWLAAASIAVLVVAILSIYNATRSFTPEQLYAKHAESFDFDFTTMGASTEDIGNAEQALENGQFDIALPILDRMLEAEPENLDYLRTKGITLMELDRYEEALAVFNTLKKSNSIVYKDEADWYIALSYLKRGDLDNCRRVLQLIDPKSSSFDKAKKLLVDID